VHEIVVPTLNTNDKGYVLTTWLFADGDHVPAGAEVAIVETSKTAEGLTIEAGGILHRRLAESQECRPGEVIGRLFPDDQQRRRFLAEDSGTPQQAPDTGIVITEPARRLIDRYGIDPAALAALGKKVIGSADVQRLADQQAPAAPPAPPTPGGRIHRLSRSQLAVAEVVSTSHRTIPAAFAVVSVTVDPALAALRAYADRERARAGLPELLIRGMAGLIDRYPLFFAAALDDGTAVLADQARVGVTIDVGRGLAIPVIGDAALGSLGTIAAAMTSFREKSLREAFTAEDLNGATIGLSLPAGDVLLTQPLIPPGLSCMAALGVTRQEPFLTPDAEIAVRQAVFVGLAYDHRLVNGRDAALFLGALKADIESPERLAELCA
jgi:2-oxoglutarate dehydrogenase E2 component (dihydrolipoamide succinyltransferase)